MPRRRIAISSGTFYTVSAGLIGLALVTRLYQIGVQELWLDEAFSCYVVTLRNWFKSILVDNNPPLYYLVLRAWTWVAGTSEAALRLPAALAGTLLVGLIIWAAREIFNRTVALWAGIVAALAPVQIYYSQQARVYPILDSLLILTWILVWRAFATNSWRGWALASAAAVTTLYCHYLAILALAPTAVLLLLKPEPGRRRRYAVFAGTSLLLFAPWMLWSFVFVHHPAVGTSWIENFWNETPKLLAIPRSLEIFALGSQAGLVPMWMGQFSSINFPTPLRLLGLSVLVFFGIALARTRGEEELGIPNLSRRKVYLIVLLLAPLAVLWLISWVKPLYAVGRYDILTYPAFPLLLGLALQKLQRGLGWHIAALAVAAFLLPVLFKLHLYYDVAEPGEAEPMARILDADVHNGDVVVFTGLRALPVLYYMSRRGYLWENGYCSNANKGLRFYCRMYPRVTEVTPAATDTNRLLGSTETARAELADYLPKLNRKTGTFWIVLWGASPGGKAKIPRADQLLFHELEAAGLKRVPDGGSLDLLFTRYRVPEQTP
jgi:hypothetical protein